MAHAPVSAPLRRFMPARPSQNGPEGEPVPIIERSPGTALDCLSVVINCPRAESPEADTSYLFHDNFKLCLDIDTEFADNLRKTEKHIGGSGTGGIDSLKSPGQILNILKGPATLMEIQNAACTPEGLVQNHGEAEALAYHRTMERLTDVALMASNSRQTTDLSLLKSFHQLRIATFMEKTGAASSAVVNSFYKGGLALSHILEHCHNYSSEERFQILGCALKSFSLAAEKSVNNSACESSLWLGKCALEAGYQLYARQANLIEGHNSIRLLEIALKMAKVESFWPCDITARNWVSAAIALREKSTEQQSGSQQASQVKALILADLKRADDRLVAGETFEALEALAESCERINKASADRCQLIAFAASFMPEEIGGMSTRDLTFLDKLKFNFSNFFTRLQLLQIDKARLALKDALGVFEYAARQGNVHAFAMPAALQVARGIEVFQLLEAEERHSIDARSAVSAVQIVNLIGRITEHFLVNGRIEQAIIFHDLHKTALKSTGDRLPGSMPLELQLINKEFALSRDQAQKIRGSRRSA